MIYWKGKIEGGKVIDEPVITMDIYSTIMDVVGASEPEYVDGKTLLPVIFDNKHYERPLFWHYPHYHKDKPHGSIRLADWKLIQYFEDMHYELYNLKDDIGETNNLAATYTDKVKELAKKMNKWRKDVNAQMPTANAHYDPARADEIVHNSEER